MTIVNWQLPNAQHTEVGTYQPRPPSTLSMSSGRKLGLLQDLILIAAAVRLPFQKGGTWLIAKPPQNVSIFYLVRYALTRIEVQGEQESTNKRSAAAAVLRKLDRKIEDDDEKPDDGRSRRSRKEDLVLNQYEQTVAMDVVAPEDIPVTFEGVY